MNYRFVTLFSVALTAISCTSPTASLLQTQAKPRIGLVYGSPDGEALQHGDDWLNQYRESLEDAGAEVVSILYKPFDQSVNALVESVDGVVVPGGNDVDPAMYHERRTYTDATQPSDINFDRFERYVIKTTLKLKHPLLGICRGMQMLNVAQGGSLIQDIPSQTDSDVVHKNDSETAYHTLSILSGSIFALIMNTTQLTTNSFHHQAVKSVGKDLKVTAVSSDGLPEVIEGTQGFFVMGVQFHPERMILEDHDERFRSLFGTLVSQAQ